MSIIGNNTMKLYVGFRNKCPNPLIPKNVPNFLYVVSTSRKILRVWIGISGLTFDFSYFSMSRTLSSLFTKVFAMKLPWATKTPMVISSFFISLAIFS